MAMPPLPMGDSLDSAFYKLFTHSGSRSTISQDNLIFIRTLIEESVLLCNVLWKQNEELLYKYDALGLNDPDTIKVALRLCSATIRRGKDVLEVLNLEEKELLKEFEEGELENNVIEWNRTFTSLISSCESVCEQEKWARHMRNHVSCVAARRSNKMRSSNVCSMFPKCLKAHSRRLS